MLIRIKRKKTPLTRPNNIAQLLKAIRKGHVQIREANRLEKLRYGRTENAPK